MKALTWLTVLVGLLIIGALIFDVYQSKKTKSDITLHIKALPNDIGPEGYIRGVVLYLQLIAQNKRR